MAVTKYSDTIEGDSGNYKWGVRFDFTGGYVGITQYADKDVKDRILLSPTQVEEMAAFIKRQSR